VRDLDRFIRFDLARQEFEFGLGLPITGAAIRLHDGEATRRPRHLRHTHAGAMWEKGWPFDETGRSAEQGLVGGGMVMGASAIMLGLEQHRVRWSSLEPD
jgi:hypothetical protein